MIICKYTKLSTAVYMPHLDMLRTVGMAIRRKNLHIKFSDGFNPHARLFFSQPLPIGTASMCEYFCADSEENAVDFMNGLNLTLPQGVKIMNTANTMLNPNPAALVKIADYEVTLKTPLQKDIDLSGVLESNGFRIKYFSKGKEVEKGVKNMIFGITNTNDKVFLRVACGNLNLRADRLVNHLLQSIGHESKITVLKTAVYDSKGKNLDELFFV